MLCLLIAVDRSSIFSIQLRALMKMKTVGDIFTASFVGGGGGCKYCTHSPNFFAGVGKEKNVCAQTGMLRAERNFSNLFASRLFITSICFLCSCFKAITFFNLSSRGPYSF